MGALSLHVAARRWRFGGAGTALTWSCWAITACMGTGASGSTTGIEYQANFDDGPDGFVLTGLWHRADLAAVCLANPGGYGLYYGQDATCTYDTGAANAGTATSPIIDLTAAVAPITLTFGSRLGSETICSFDKAEVVVSDDGFATSVVVAAKAGCGPGGILVGGGWTTTSVDLSAFAGSSIQIRYAFSTEDAILNAFLGWGVDDIVITDSAAPKLSLEGQDCQDDAFPLRGGHQVSTELWMRHLDGPATGFQAFVEYDDSVLAFRPDLSTYTLAPFPLHIIPPANWAYAGGKLVLDGSEALGAGGSSADALLATIVFDVLDECAVTALDFDPAALFDSELSYQGDPLPTKLDGTGDLRLDDTPPSITCPADIEVPSELNVTPDPCGGALVTFTVTATDDCDASPTIACTPPSGSVFPVGTTTVTCTATDDCGNVGTCDFDVTVDPINLALVTVTLSPIDPFVVAPFSRCIHVVTDDCGVFVDVPLTFVPDGFGGATATEVIEIPCGPWTQLCLKDQQHTKWATAALVRSGTSWVAAPVVLLPGDTDDDGDVDINDVTWLVATFGTLAAPGGCPWDGSTRDADFGDNGAVGTQDYSAQSGQFLTSSSCACTLPAAGETLDRRTRLPLREVDFRVRDLVDLDGDADFDGDDVRIFERRHALPSTLSGRLLGAARQGDG